MHELIVRWNLASVDCQRMPPKTIRRAGLIRCFVLQRIGDAVTGGPIMTGLRPDLSVILWARSARLYKQNLGKIGAASDLAGVPSDARFLHQPDAGSMARFLAAFPDGHNSVYDFLLQLWTRGGDLLDSLAGSFDTREAADALGVLPRHCGRQGSGATLLPQTPAAPTVKSSAIRMQPLPCLPNGAVERESAAASRVSKRTRPAESSRSPPRVHS